MKPNQPVARSAEYQRDRDKRKEEDSESEIDYYDLISNILMAFFLTISIICACIISFGLL
jgi:hypothetical protein